MKIDKKLLNIPEIGDQRKLYTRSTTLIANGYERIVFGGRGPYIEFTKIQIIDNNLYIPSTQLYRISDPKSFYVEFRTNDSSNTMVYYQMRSVRYADYKINYFYVSAYEVFTGSNSPCIEPELTTSNTTSELWFDFGNINFDITN